MKKINLKEIQEVMSEQELKKVLGGMATTSSGTCGWTTTTSDGVIWYDCGVSKEEAQHKASLGTNGYWCCDSCGQTSYCGA